MESTTVTKRPAKEVLQEARDYLADGHWTTGLIHVPENVNSVEEPYGFSVDGKTCLIGSIAYVLDPDFTFSHTEDAAKIIQDLDGEALDALYKALPLEWRANIGYADPPVDLKVFRIYRFNDTQSSDEPILEVLDKAIASLD